ncbi:nucleotide disphospho-sugar-binding domain-containing protein [Sciscionella sediminilitoris]|uniref:nucleotide disphospho-sugar-binding domain-containing protein n=1 Tax=Sciscionella sediminilitoris TaxID=1445613 RepID=UPI0004DED7AE|nr:nucleotide disphospho-sugar-binding domain-containing protein [Sciscionella sp. SE31]
MRVLFAGLPERSHLYCAAPLAWALIAAGHEVRVAAPPSFVPTVHQVGLTAAPLSAEGIIHELMAEAPPETQDEPTTNWSRCEPGEVSWPELLERYEVGVPYGFALYNDHMVDDLVDLVRDWRPDLVVRDPIAFAGGLAAHIANVPQVRLLWCADVWGRSRRTFRRLRTEDPVTRDADPLAAWLGAAAARFGAEYDEVISDGHATIDLLPAPLRLPSDLVELPMRFIAHNGPASTPDWLRAPAERPRVCLTLGTTNAESYGADYLSVPTLLRACADADFEVVATLLPAQQEAVRAAGPVPGNARLVDPVALHLLLPSCSAIVHHGGFGSFATALAAGVPQLMVSTSLADNEVRGQAYERSGAGRFFHHTEARPDTVRDALDKLLAPGSGAAQAAGALAAEVAAMPTPADVVHELEELVTSY